MMSEIPSYIFSKYVWYNERIQEDKASVHVLQFSNQISIMFCNFSVKNVLLKDGRNLIKWEKNLHEKFCF